MFVPHYLGNLCAFYNLGLRAIKNSADDTTSRITWRRIRNDLTAQYLELTAMKELNPERQSKQEIQDELDKLLGDIEAGYQDLESE